MTTSSTIATIGATFVNEFLFMKMAAPCTTMA
jgi:hypothetical protein